MLAELSTAAHTGATVEGLGAKVTLPRGGLAGLAGGGDLSGRASAVAVVAAGGGGRAASAWPEKLLQALVGCFGSAGRREAVGEFDLPPRHLLQLPVPARQQHHQQQCSAANGRSESSMPPRSPHERVARPGRLAAALSVQNQHGEAGGWREQQAAAAAPLLKVAGGDALMAHVAAPCIACGSSRAPTALYSTFLNN